jgi:hypothetical protein
VAPFPLVWLVLLLTPVLMAAPVLAGTNPSPTVYGLTVLPLVLAVFSLWVREGHMPIIDPLLLAVAYVVLLIVSAWRGHGFGSVSFNAAALQTVQFSLLALLGMFAFMRERDDRRRGQYVDALCWSPVVFVAINVALQVAGFVPPDQEPSTGQATMLQLVGVSTERVSFPMSGGFNGIGPTAVAGLVVSGTFLQRRIRPRWALAGTLLSLYVIFAIDSRGALLFAVLAIALATAAPRARNRGFGWVAIALPVLPVLLVLALTGLAETEVRADLNRQGVGDISTGTGRTLVWDEVTKVLTKPSLDNVWGYGAKGQIESGASVNYSTLFSDPDPLSHSAHNLVLQTALDTGWLGAALLIALAAIVMTRLTRFSLINARYAALRNAALALLLLGIVQAAPTPVHSDSFAFWLLVVFASMVSTPGDTAPRTPRQEQARAPAARTRSVHRARP